MNGVYVHLTPDPSDWKVVSKSDRRGGTVEEIKFINQSSIIMITLRQAEAICRKKEITSEDVKNLQEIQLHIAAYEDEENKRVKKLCRLIDKKIYDFFGFSDDMFSF